MLKEILDEAMVTSGNYFKDKGRKAGKSITVGAGLTAFVDYRVGLTDNLNSIPKQNKKRRGPIDDEIKRITQIIKIIKKLDLSLLDA